uniref:UvrD-like helicase ATP-binding domain-containing protein n=1 Tax=Tetradesmus obliquus TaxID=3088 RepID=A0A383WM93_TETOB|eukprot:jgi/Sobl393_1/639/SZX78521.1
MQLQVDSSSTQGMHRRGTSRVLQSLRAAAVRLSNARQSVAAAASCAYSAPASSSSSRLLHTISQVSCGASQTQGLRHHSMQQQHCAPALGFSSSSSSTMLRRGTVATATKRPDITQRLVRSSRRTSSPSSGSSSSSSNPVGTAAQPAQPKPSRRTSSRTARKAPAEPAAVAAAAATAVLQPIQQQPNTTSSSSSSSSSSPVQLQSSMLDPQHHAAVQAYLAQLNDEQQLAAFSPEQHVKVIAGPGSGKTRVVAARVAHLIASGHAPESLLVITFTRKAAGELLQRLQELLGEAITARLRPSTFHSLCTNLLRHYRQHTHLPNFQVASEDDAAAMVKSILENAEFRKELGYFAGEQQDRKGKDEVTYYRKHISNIKNFCVNIERRSGAELIAQMAAAGRRLPGGDNSNITRRIAAMYDEYVARMAQQQLLDFDDLLHHCLALLLNNAEVRAAVHRRWRHVLVDESQDTNLCQFELVQALTSPSSSLFMVGTPTR